MSANCTEICPECGGGHGYRYLLTETHVMGGAWGEAAAAGDSGLDVKQSLVECLECGTKFQFRALERKGYVA
jgi:hypothetical protein